MRGVYLSWDQLAQALCLDFAIPKATHDKLRRVQHRDDGRCAFVGSAGRCTETGFLEYHHVTPYADGGDATTANIQLRCDAHNAFEADQWFGASMVRERRDGTNSATAASSGPAD